MANYKSILDIHGFPKKNYKFSTIKILFNSRVFFFSKFKRRFDVCLDLQNFNFVNFFYQDRYLERYYLDKISKIKFFNINFKILSKFCFYFLKKEKIFLKDNDIILFGPYSNSYSHAIHEFFTRLIFIQNKKKINYIYVPLNLKKILESQVYKKIFFKFKFKYYSTDKNYIFYNCNYLTHTHNRWAYKKKKKIVPVEFKKLINNFVKKAHNSTSKKKYDDFKYIIISRSNAIRRRLINEDILYEKLKKYGFKKVFFEKLSFKQQIEISKSCKIMLGYHGAGLTNLFFMKPGSQCVEIINENYTHEHIKYFAKSVNVKYKKFVCKKNYKNLDGSCDVDEIENYLVSNFFK